MLDYVYLQTFKLLLQRYLCSYCISVTQSHSANCTLQESMDRIIDIIGKRKNRESFLFKTLEPQVRSVHVLAVLLYCVKIGSVASTNYCVQMFYKQHCLGSHILFRFNRVMIKNLFIGYFLDVVHTRSFQIGEIV